MTIKWCYWSVSIYSNIWLYWLFEIHSMMMILMIQAEILCLQKTDDFKGFEAFLMRNLFKRELLCLLPRVLKRLRASAPNLPWNFQISDMIILYTCFFMFSPSPLKMFSFFLNVWKASVAKISDWKWKCGFLFLGSVKSQNIKKIFFLFLNAWEVSGEDIKLKIIFSSFFSRTCEKRVWKRYPVEENRSQQTLLSFFHVNPQGTGLLTEATTFFVSNAENFVQNNFSQILYQDTTQVSSKWLRL